jgi:hypothetical protein
MLKKMEVVGYPGLNIMHCRLVFTTWCYKHVQLFYVNKKVKLLKVEFGAK